MKHSFNNCSIRIFAKKSSIYLCTIFSVFPKTANSVWAILQDPSELNNKSPTEMDEKFLKNVETATEEIQNQLNVDTIGLISS